MKLEYVFFCMMVDFRYRDRILSVYSEKEGKQNDYLNAPLLRSTQPTFNSKIGNHLTVCYSAVQNLSSDSIIYIGRSALVLYYGAICLASEHIIDRNNVRHFWSLDIYVDLFIKIIQTFSATEILR